MTDSQESLRHILEELHEVLESSSDLDPAARAELRAAAEEISHALDRAGADATLAGSLRTRLGDAVERFEGKHPKLTAIVGRVADALADLGI